MKTLRNAGSIFGWVSALLILATFGVVIIWLAGSFEPRYDGMIARDYLRGVLNTNATSSAKQTAINLVPTRVAVPILIQFTQAQDPRWRGWYQRLYPRLPAILQKRLGPPKSSDLLVQGSLTALGYFGAESKAAVPQLLRLEAACDRNDTNVWQTRSGLLFLRPATLRGAIIGTLTKIGPNARDAVPHFVTHLQQTNGQWAYGAEVGEIWNVLTFFETLGPAAEAAVDGIIPLLSNDNERIRAKAARTLGAIGPAAERARPQIERLLTDRWELVRDAAMEALIKQDMYRKKIIQ